MKAARTWMVVLDSTGATLNISVHKQKTVPLIKLYTG